MSESIINYNFCRFYFNKGYYIYNNNLSNNQCEIDKLDRLKIHYIYNFSNEDNKIIFKNNSIVKDILYFINENEVNINYIQSSLLNKKLGNQSLDDFLSDLKDNSKILYDIILNYLDEYCCICFENNNDAFFDCAHGVCSECVSKIQNCPLCRANITNIYKFNEKKKIEKKEDLNSDDVDEEEDMYKKKNMKIIFDIDEFVDKRINSIYEKVGGFLSPSDQHEIFILCNLYKDKIKNKLKNDNIKSESIKCFTIGILYILFNEKDLFFKLSSPDRILRFLNTLTLPNQFEDYYENEILFSTIYADKNSKLKLYGGGKKYKRDLLELINNLNRSDDNDDQIMRKKASWKNIFKFVHPFETSNKEKFNDAYKLANSFYNINDMSKINGFINKKLDEKDDSVLEYLSDKPGLAFRLMRVLALKFGDNHKFRKFILDVIPNMSFEQQYNLYHVYKKDKSNSNVILNRNNTLRWN